ncbi:MULTISPECIES: NADH:ubiquinone reductase (Na(+)-transporting) subunit E [Runella]|jgi:Na+-transporting NADH:ubiquinone oxidoreductase subunit E|uniref:Na(+)-translocating NADH-quinone reductase subunit E n=2 Tax=Runella TaxID=105 RepID=A0A369I985_9BACT|nr:MULTISPECIES: NADH:ubiquinone reductase (Na(+)-transporting) subunit E [Runella]MCP1384195.1 NADH:ubiquinone reductase (Na(+)-transporting) subunit E [Runella salmonicolor]RDB04083.1 NADH:ubiquinone reductase (Na(+)-transporting) subunit E [Runella aurantiaca]
MQHLINILIKTIFVENVIFAFFLGMCSFLAVSKKIKTAFGLGLAVIFVMVLTTPLNYLILRYLLFEGALGWIHPSLASVDLTFLSFILFISTIAGAVQLVEMVVEKFLPALYTSLGIFLPLITVNCSILGASLFMQEREYNFAETTAFSLGAGIGFFLAIVLLAAIRERLRYSNIPEPLQGLGIAMIVTALMGLAFLSFSGIQL